jgi:hypothetical protein
MARVLRDRRGGPLKVHKLEVWTRAERRAYICSSTRGTDTRVAKARAFIAASRNKKVDSAMVVSPKSSGSGNKVDVLEIVAQSSSLFVLGDCPW